MPDIKKMFEVCNYVVKNKARIIDVCEKFEMSRRTAQKYTGEYLRNYIDETGDELATQLLEELEKVKDENEKETQTKKVDVDLDEVINHIIKAKATVNQVSLMFGVSESTIHKYIAYIKDTDKELYENLCKAQEEVSKRGHVLGGKTGVRGPSYNDFEATEMAEVMLEENFTISDASRHFSVPKSSLYERVKAVDDDDIQSDLQEMFDRRKLK